VKVDVGVGEGVCVVVAVWEGVGEGLPNRAIPNLLLHDVNKMIKMIKLMKKAYR
jgi:hypothetical protein